MSQSFPIAAPAGFVPDTALSFADASGAAVLVDATHPLPVTTAAGAATSTPLAGTSAGGLIGPFAPQPGRAIWLTLTGSWTGSIVVRRSLDGGTTRLPLTVAGRPWGRFTGNAQEPIGEETIPDALYYLDATIASGTLAYDVRQ